MKYDSDMFLTGFVRFSQPETVWTGFLWNNNKKSSFNWTFSLQNKKFAFVFLLNFIFDASGFYSSYSII